MEVNKEKIWFFLQFFFDKSENAGQVVEIANGVYGADTVTANYLQFWFRRFRSEAWRVVGWLEGGQTQAEVAQAIGVSQNVITRIWNRLLETGSAGRRPGHGRRWATTPNEDRYLVLTARRH
ncbi:hypothetical protein TNCV_3550981 [Trichonephila clavipes]|nr:hypothetical protein TNCV_3550981 [Trichonephila clavipes]